MEFATAPTGIMHLVMETMAKQQNSSSIRELICNIRPTGSIMRPWFAKMSQASLTISLPLSTFLTSIGDLGHWKGMKSMVGIIHHMLWACLRGKWLALPTVCFGMENGVAAR
jgi:hypothetical protein